MSASSLRLSRKSAFGIERFGTLQAKRGLFVVVFLLVWIGSAPSTDVSRQSITISVVALPEQNSPLDIEDFHYAPDAIQVSLYNHADKDIAGVTIRGKATTPTGCSVEPVPATFIGGGVEAIKVVAHGKAITSSIEAPVSPASLIGAARDRRTAHLQVEMEILEVRFTDGTKWREEMFWSGQPHGVVQLPPSEARIDECPEAVGTIELLETASRTEFRDDIPASRRESDAEKRKIPILRFECDLTSGEAICPSR